MAELITRYVKLGIAWVIVVVGIVAYNNVSCRQIRGPEMEPSIQRESYRMIFPAKFKPGEHVVHDDIIYYEYEHTGEAQNTFAARVMGLPGDRIKIEKGDVYRNGTKLDSGYVGQANRSDDSYEEIVVPRDSFFVLMDSRRGSTRFDSRGIGPVGKYAVGGKVRP